MADWGYTQKDGPATWVKVAPAAAGLRQSPIDINPKTAHWDDGLSATPLDVSYIPSHSKSVKNNGKSITVSIDGSGSSLTGGPLKDKYQAAQFHFHWGQSSDTGSEHRINGRMYAAEGHIVHYNTAKFSSFGDAAQADGGLCVLGVFLQPGAENPNFQKIVELTGKVPFAGDEAPVDGGYDPALLLPADRTKYWTYLGSLTTPPCFESVTWILFKDPIEVSEAQLNALRSLGSLEKGSAVTEDPFGGKIVENYRPPLPIGNRLVRASFDIDTS